MSETKNRLAVAATTKAALENNWFFREQAISDQGIDAHVEKFHLLPGKAGEDEVGTGRLLALQIKGGPHYFREPAPNGWWFRFEERKRRLWLGHALPVMVVLVDLEADEIYWQRVTPGTVRKAGKSFKVEVPRHQRMSTADSQWTEIASGLEVKASAQMELSLNGIAPAVAQILRGREPSEKADAALLAMHLATGRTNAEGTARSILTAVPGWVSRNPDWAWTALAAYASSHDAHEIAAEAYLLAAKATGDDDHASRRLVAAALHLRDFEPDRADRFLQDARALQSPNEIFIASAATIFSARPGEAHPLILDPRLSRADPDVDGSALAQRVLARHARRLGDLDGAIRHARAARMLDQADATTQEELADYLLARWNTHGALTSDLTEAIELLERVIESSRPWSGPVLEARGKLITAYALAGRWESTIQTALPPPHGTAEPSEVQPDLLRAAAFAARALGRLGVRDAACELMVGGDARDKLMQVHVEYVEMQTAALNGLRLKALDEAIVDNRYDDIARFCVTVAASGVDTTERMRPFVERGIIPTQVQQLASVLLHAHADLDEALPRLRDLARTDPVAGQHLIGLLQSAGRHVDAADAAHALYELSGSEVYLLDRANCLIDAGGGAPAVAAAQEAVARTSVRPTERGRLLTFLGGAAADEGDWATAEVYLNRVLDLFQSPTDSAVWRVVTCLVNQGRTTKAAKLIALHKPEVRDLEQAELWLRAHATLRWTERIAYQAYGLAERFEDPKLSTALLGHIVLNTHGTSLDASEGAGGVSSPAGNAELEELDDAELEARRRMAQDTVPGELHRRAFALMERLVSIHGDATGITVIKGESTEALVEQMVETLKKTSRADQALADLVPMVRDSRLPIGFLAGAFHRGYATLLLQRALGVLVASSPDDDEHDAEVLVARDSVGGRVVVDAAAVLTLTGLRVSADLTGQFIALMTPPAAMHGLQRAAFDVRGLAGSPGSMRWDPVREGIEMSELSDQEFSRLFKRTEMVQLYSERLQVASLIERSISTEIGLASTHHEWVDVLDLAREKGVPVWSDDLGLRRVAREAGLKAFGTPALVDGIRGIQLDSSSDSTGDDSAIELAHARQIEMATDFIVDLPLSEEDLLNLAQNDQWRPQAAAAAITRPIWWLNNPEGFTTVQTIYKEASLSGHEVLVGWQLAAMYGAARCLPPESASGFLALIAMAGFDESLADEVRIEGLRRARQVAVEVGAPDPAGGLQLAADLLHRAGLCPDPLALVARLVLALGNDATTH